MKNRRRWSCSRGQRGFSLIELMAAIAILMVIVVLMSMIFAASNNSWRLGTDKAENNTLGRGAVNKIADDLQYAVADDLLTFVINPVGQTKTTCYGVESDAICFVSLVNDSSDTNRTAREVFYYVKPSLTYEGLFDLVMGVYDDELITDPDNHCYAKQDWYSARPEDKSGDPEEAHFIAENVACLAFHATYVDSKGNLVTTREYDSLAHENKLPLYVDVYLEVIDGTPARTISQRIEAGDVGPTDPWTTLYAERNLKRYTKRVYFHNRAGYQVRLPATQLVR